MGHRIGASFKEKRKCLTSSRIRTPYDPTQPGQTDVCVHIKCINIHEYEVFFKIIQFLFRELSSKVIQQCPCKNTPTEF